MATSHYGNEGESYRFRSADRTGQPPPPPATPYLTKKLLTMVTSSDRHGGEGKNRQRRQSSPISPADSIAEAMKSDLEELVGYIDNLAFDQTGELAATTTRARTPSMNKQLFSGEDHHANDTSRRERTNDRKDVFRDRTNRFGKDTSQTDTQGRLGGDAKAVATPLKDQSSSYIHSIRERTTSLEQQPIILDRVRTPTTGREPAGSPPPQETSFCFHDESLSLTLSQSEDTDESCIGEANLDSNKTEQQQSRERSERSPPRLLSTLQHIGFNSTPTRAKAISFRPVSKDPTPSKPRQATSTLNNTGNDVADPLRENIFDKEEIELNPNNALRQNDLYNRRGTPHTHHVVDRLQQENLARKGNEWWRARHVPIDSSPRRTMSTLSDSKDEIFPDEDNESKSLQWEADVTTPLPRQRNTVKGTPHTFGRRGDPRDIDAGNNHMEDSDLQRTVPETPVTNQGKVSNLVLTSPESAKKLLTEAITALKEARQERDDAREWASNIKESVHKWVEDQRELIRKETALISSNISPVSSEFLQQQHQAVEDLINKLRNEIKNSKSNTEAQLETMLVKQDGQIRELSRQVSDVKEQLSCVVKGNTSDKGNQRSRPQKTSKYSNIDAPGSIHKTPQNSATRLTRTASRSEKSSACSPGAIVLVGRRQTVVI